MIGFGRIVRRFVRKFTKPIPGDKAVYWKNKLSVAYAVIAWHAFGIVCYYMVTGRSDWPLYYGLKTEEEAAVRPGVYFARVLGLQKAQIIRIHGFTKVDELDYDAATYVEPGKESLEDPTSNSNTDSEQ